MKFKLFMETFAFAFVIWSKYHLLLSRLIAERAHDVLLLRAIGEKTINLHY